MSSESRRDLSNALTTAAAAAGMAAQASAGALFEAEAEIKQLTAILAEASAKTAALNDLCSARGREIVELRARVEALCIVASPEPLL